ncbi:MAG: metal-dependent transcriptional regulator [Gemmatimonadales bacterium]
MVAEVRPNELSKSIEDYLKVIYKLGSSGGPAQTSAIAHALSVAPPSVSGMLKRLSDAGFVRHEPYRGVHLTTDGARAALRMIRRHRILETYLTSKLGYSWDTVHEEAERMEHAVSDVLIERMALALGNPRYDPHGAPIPTEQGELIEPDARPLTEVEVGATVVLTMVADQDGDRLRYLESLDLTPGARFVVRLRQPFNGPVTIELAPDDVKVIGFELASSLMCTVVDAVDR